MPSTEHTKEEESSLRSAALDDKEKTSQGADLLLSLAETASEHAQLSVRNEAEKNSRSITEKSPFHTSIETEIQSGAPESTRSHHLPHPYGWQRPYYYHHPYGGMHPLTHYPPHYPMPAEEVPSSPLRKRVVLESIDLSPDDDVKRPRLEESRQESSPTSQSPRSTTDYPDEKGATKRESVISPSSSSSNETTQQGVTDIDSQTARPTSRPSTPGLTSDQSRQYPGYHGPPYMGYPPGFPHYQYGAHPSIAYPYCAPSFYYRGGMMQPYNNHTNNKPTVSPTPPRDDRNAMKGLVLAARSDLLKSFPATDTNCHRCIPLKQPLPGRRWSRDAEHAQQSAMPEFSQLVNFPDYLARGREGKTGAAATGKKNCVMCGKLRPCSAATMNRRGSTDGEDDGAMHIIPRQNKGVCTACDVAVWAVAGATLEDGTPIEIKWCKGCKNFRPWAAFGAKGMATKCVRCRNRQKEKYAAAKESVKLELPHAIEAYAR